MYEKMEKGSEFLSKEPNLLKLDGKVTILGDVHGQLFDLISIL